MIRIKVGVELYEFPGTISANVTVKYLFEKRDPFNPALFYRHGKYYQDSLDVDIVCDADEYENLYYKTHEALHNGGFYLIAWETVTGYQYRKVKSVLPYPSQIRFLTDSVKLKLESEPYDEVIKNMPNVTQNSAWNQSTISNTIWV